VLTEALAAGGDEAKRALDAMMGRKKIDVVAIMLGGPLTLSVRSSLESILDPGVNRFVHAT
jgi:hypothetical protein